MDEIFSLLVRDAKLTNALATVVTTCIACFALIISVVSLCVAHVTLKNQERHNILSVKPIPMVSVVDYEDRLTVKIRNHGSGPLIIKNIQVKRASQARESLIEWFEAGRKSWVSSWLIA